jgi:hypothetical protein
MVNRITKYLQSQSEVDRVLPAKKVDGIAFVVKTSNTIFLKPMWSRFQFLHNGEIFFIIAPEDYQDFVTSNILTKTVSV